MQIDIRILGTAAATLSAAIREARGREICGFITQGRSPDLLFIRLASAISSGWAVAIPGYEVRRLQDFIEDRGERVIAFVHSHAFSTDLSESDRNSLVGSPWPWLVVCQNPAGLVASLSWPDGKSDRPWPPQ
jgi:proteasome lid subunit RPN8/RPN11